MKRYFPAIGFVLLAAILLLLLWLVTAPRKPVLVQAHQAPQPYAATSLQTSGSPTASPDEPAASAASTAVDDSPPNDDLIPTHRPSGPARASLADAIGPEVGTGLTPGIVLENMRGAVRDYGLRFGGNPFGINREITSRLNGANPGHIVFLKPEDGLRLNDRGELIDNWGTPFFFHQISGTEMEIRSAGADRKMWTKDDLVIR